MNRRLVPPAGSGQQGSAWYDARSFSDPIVTNDTGFMNIDYEPFIGLQGLAGTIQRAIQVSGINGGVNHPSLDFDGLGEVDRDDRVYGPMIKNVGGPTYTGNSNDHFTSAGIGGSKNSRFGHVTEPTMRSHIDTEHLAGAPAGEMGQLFDGSPGFVTQGDILSMIGPALTARGDTFKIRTYGDSVSELTGEIVGRAWLETIVQRVAEPVSAQEPSAGVDEIERWRPADGFGRRFEIVSMRWLNEDEI